MDKATFIEKLDELDACCEARAFIVDSPLTPQELWETCERTGWMFWLIGKVETPANVYVKIACDIAERVLPIFEAEHPEDKRPREAIEAARAGKAHPADIDHGAAVNGTAERAAEIAAHYAYYTAVYSQDAWVHVETCSEYARMAAARAADAARMAAYAAAARMAAYAAAYTAARMAAYAADAYANRAERKAHAEIIRRHVPWAQVAALLAPQVAA